MSFNQHILEKGQFVPGIVPVDLKTNPGATSDYISMKGYGRCAIVFFAGAGTNGDDPTLTLLQATAVAGTGAKALNITRIDKKQAASNLLSTGTFTTSTSASPASNDTFSTNTWTNSNLAEQVKMVVIDVKAEDLDIDGGFDCIICNVSDVGTNAQLGCLFYYLHEPRNSKATMDSAIAD